MSVTSTAAKAAAPPRPQERLQIVIGGHVDHGKSTVIGRLLADTGSLPEGKLEQVRANCARHSKPFEYAFLLDALEDEQAQGITIDAARVFFTTAQRDYIIIDAPGHIEFLKNMVSGASRADAALLVIDAMEGVQENSRRHGYMMSMLGIRHIAVVINKMDLVGYDEAVYKHISAEYTAFLRQIGVEATCCIPVSGREGVGIAESSANMPWHKGPSVLEVLDGFPSATRAQDAPFRLSVQGVYKFTANGDDRRIVAGTVESGELRPGDAVVFYPSGKRSRVKSIEAFAANVPKQAGAGAATGFTLEEQIFVTRGELATRATERRPKVSRLLRVNLFWLGRAPLVCDKEYLLKIGSARVPMRLEEVQGVIDASDLTQQGTKTCVERHEVAKCTLKLGRPIAFDLAEHCATTSRFVIVEDYEICGGGIIDESLPDQQQWVREKVRQRESKWEPSGIDAERRWERYNQRATMLLISAASQTDRKSLARALEAQLFADGRLVYFLGIGNLLYGIDADIERTVEKRAEHLRRLGEVANLMLDAGMLLVVTAADIDEEEQALIAAAVGEERLEVIWIGGQRQTSPAVGALQLSEEETLEQQVGRIKGLLQETKAIFRPW
ncbi:MAG: adenylyl-sulfate kinase [Deltaproteobacteria bacterium]|nr:adenylyl-sulfate kinase [Deltaproteobacteria bacterium]